jgi:hypothetical protein
MKSHPLTNAGGLRYARLASRREYARIGMRFADDATRQAFEIHQLEQDLRAMCNALAEAEQAPSLAKGATDSAWIEHNDMVLRVDYSIDRATGDLHMESTWVFDANVMDYLPEATLDEIEVLALEAHLAAIESEA